MSKWVEARCSVCGKIQIRKKGASGIPCVNGGIYCGTMHVMKWLDENKERFQ